MTRRKRKRFSIGPLYVGLAIGMAQALALHVTPLIADFKGPRQPLPPLLQHIHRHASNLRRIHLGPIALGIGVATIGLVSVAIVPPIRVLWWLAAAGAVGALAVLLALMLRAAYLT